jgi:hypothetical protein
LDMLNKMFNKKKDEGVSEDWRSLLLI